MNNKRNGKGTHIYDDGNRYEGEWVDDLMRGKGTYYYKNGEMYVGDWYTNYIYCPLNYKSFML